MLTETLVFLRERIVKLFLIALVLFVVCAVASTIYFNANPDVATEIIEDFMEGHEDLITEEGKVSALGLFLNNSRAAAIAFAFGFIAPLALLFLAINAGSIGAMLALTAEEGMASWKVILFGLAPHGIFELSAFFLAVALGLYVGTYIFRKNKPYSWGLLGRHVLLSLVVVAIPLIAFAAVIEAYITPILLDLVFPQA